MATTAAVILAAGQGTRLKSKIPKVLHLIAGRPMIDYVIATARELKLIATVVVVGHGADQVRRALGDRVAYAVQSPQLGTGHAVLQTQSVLEGKSDAVLVLYGDMPLLSTEVLRNLVRMYEQQDATIAMLTCIRQEAMGFGRVVRGEEDRVLEIVEESQASPRQLEIRELNLGVYCFSSSWLWSNLPRLTASPKGEYYLTDLVALASDQGRRVEAIVVEDPVQVLGINDRVHLAAAERAVRTRIAESLMRGGVTIVDPHTTYVDAEVVVGADTVIRPNTHLYGQTHIGTDCIIGPNTMVRDSAIGDDCHVQFSVVEEAVLEDHVSVGPFAHLRKGAHLAEGVHMGNFGEVKNSSLGAGSKMGHFSYLGDAQVGKDVNIGAGTVTCNFDGHAKHQTVIEDGAFIGSDTMLRAPVRVGKRARTGAGSVVTHDVPDDVTVIGAPARPTKKTKDTKAIGE